MWKKQYRKFVVRSVDWKKYLGKKALVIEVEGTKAPLVFSELTFRENGAIVPPMKQGDLIYMWYIERPGGQDAIVGLDHNNNRVYHMTDKQINDHICFAERLESIPGVSEKVKAYVEEASLALRPKV